MRRDNRRLALRVRYGGEAALVLLVRCPSCVRPGIIEERR
jgi:hypothetical protein